MKPTRREAAWLLATIPAAKLLAQPSRFRLAICNETYDPLPFEKMCLAVKQAGYGGVEVAPPTLSDDPASLPMSRRRELRNIMRSEGLEYVGLHRLLTLPNGLHVTTPDRAVRERSWGYLRRMIDLCADLGDGGIMVFGGSKERSTKGGATVSDAVARIKEGLAAVAPVAEARGVTILLEPLAPQPSDVLNTMDEVVAVVRGIGSPAVTAMFDTHNAAGEKIPHAAVVRKHFQYIRHVHFNELDGRYPGAGNYNFRAILQALRDLSYRHWISVEVFDFTGGGVEIGVESIRFIRDQEAQLPATRRF